MGIFEPECWQTALMNQAPLSLASVKLGNRTACEPLTLESQRWAFWAALICCLGSVANACFSPSVPLGVTAKDATVRQALCAGK